MKGSSPGIALFLATLREKRNTTLTWLVAGAIAMYFEAAAIAAELRDFPGGAKALATSIMPTIEALRIIRWPADRLDTLGGYLAYHNITLFNFFIALYIGIQGARLIRTLEERGDINFFLTAGLSRNKIALIRSGSIVFSLVLISVGLGAGTALALKASNEANTSGAFITMLAGGICVLPFFGLGFLISQFFTSARVASGVTSFVVTVAYVLSNISGKYRWLNWFESVSPFGAANKSRPVIPGFEADYLSWVEMTLFAIALIALATALWSRRDVSSTTNTPRIGAKESKKNLAKEWTPKSLLSDMLWRQRFGLLAWPITTMGFIAVFMSMMPGIIDIWEKFAFLEQFSASGFGSTAEEQYLAMVFEILPPFLAGYLIAQGSIWSTEFIQGRVQILLSTPISWSSLVFHRITAALLVTQMMILGSIAAVVITASQQGTTLDQSGIFRVWVMSTLFVLAFAGTNILLVVILRGKNVTQVLSVYVGAAWLVGFMSPYLGWPDWIVRLSIFDAFGHPFIEWPSRSSMVVIASMITAGIAGAIYLGNRSPKAP